MNIKTLGLKLAGGLLAVAFVITALAGHAGPASANDPNCKLGPCPVDTRPDLKVSYFNAVKSGDMMVVVLDISNSSSTPVYSPGASKYRILVNGQVAATGAASPAQFQIGYMWSTNVVLPKPAGSKATVQVIVDPDNEVDESNENNNTASTSINFL